MWSSFKSIINTLQLSFKNISAIKNPVYYKIKLRYWWASTICNMPFYAVARGRERGIYLSWPECKEQIEGIKYAIYKKFDTEEQAKQFIKDNKGGNRLAPAVIPAYAHIPDPIECVDNESLFTSLESRLTKMECLLVPLIDEIKKSRMELDTLRKVMFTANVNASLKRQFSTHGEEEESGSTSKYRKAFEYSKHVDEERGSTSKCRKVSVSSSESETIDLIDAVSNAEKEYKFDTDKDGYVQVYTDGACSKNGHHNAKAGLGVYFGENHPFNTSKPVARRATNNCGEIQAATCAINLARKAGISKLCINTDSQFVINAMTKWITGWKAKSWKLADGSNVKNRDDFIELDATAKHMTIKWNYVKAHCGILGNERADELARQGAEQYKVRKQW